MDKLVYDVRFDVRLTQDPLGPSGFMSFKRLAELLQKNETAPGESLTHIVITPRGLDLRFSRSDTST